MSTPSQTKSMKAGSMAARIKQATTNAEPFQPSKVKRVDQQALYANGTMVRLVVNDEAFMSEEGASFENACLRIIGDKNYHGRRGVYPALWHSTQKSWAQKDKPSVVIKIVDLSDIESAKKEYTNVKRLPAKHRAGDAAIVVDIMAIGKLQVASKEEKEWKDTNDVGMVMFKHTTLHEYLDQYRDYPSRVMEIFLSAYKQLTVLHSFNESGNVILHQDVKAGNIVIKQIAVPGKSKEGQVMETNTVLFIDLEGSMQIDPDVPLRSTDGTQGYFSLSKFATHLKNKMVASFGASNYHVDDWRGVVPELLLRARSGISLEEDRFALALTALDSYRKSQDFILSKTLSLDGNTGAYVHDKECLELILELDKEIKVVDDFLDKHLHGEFKDTIAFYKQLDVLLRRVIRLYNLLHAQGNWKALFVDDTPFSSSFRFVEYLLQENEKNGMVCELAPTNRIEETELPQILQLFANGIQQQRERERVGFVGKSKDELERTLGLDVVGAAKVETSTPMKKKPGQRRSYDSRDGVRRSKTGDFLVTQQSGSPSLEVWARLGTDSVVRLHRYSHKTGTTKPVFKTVWICGACKAEKTQESLLQAHVDSSKGCKDLKKMRDAGSVIVSEIVQSPYPF